MLPLQLIQIFPLIKNNWKLIVIVLAAIFLFSSGWYMRTVFYDAAEAKKLAKAIQEKEKLEAKLNSKSAEVEQLLAEERAKIYKLNQDLKNARKTDINYTCIVPVSGVQYIKARITKKPTSKSNNSGR